MTVAYFNLNLRRLFPHAPYCLDHTTTFYGGQPWQARLDIMKLDNWIIARHGKYDGAMRDRIMELFGAEAVAFIERLLLPEPK